ncbi:MAG: putative Permease of the major facilitator superfamily protein [Rickettsiaceae bacterium]|jgi:DHA1 family bicyclomycin/chloramphenicol resistance-like MFS transporter|nr:putative Permease of the major facilitator superfamily protein [Rickettsiaceae bacterium]
MLEKPLFNALPVKVADYMLIGLVTLMYIMLCAEADMYVPAFPQMIHYFRVEENHIQLILSVNFAGLCVAGLVAGPLSDSYGRRKILLGGLFLFLVSSIGCVYTDNFKWMLGWRLLQGISASVPMVIGAAIFFDKYSAEQAGKLIGFINSIITASMAGAPVIGAWLSQIFDWRANFIVILAMALLSFVGTLLFVEETLPDNKRKKFDLLGIGRDYFQLSTSFRFLTYTLIANFSFVVIVVYVANLSVIFINYLGMDLSSFSYYQATTMATFVVFSLLSIKLIDKKGIDFTKNLGAILGLIGSVGVLYISYLNKNNVNIICLSMAFIAAGGAMMAGTFGLYALGVFPGMNGTSLAMMTAIRQSLASVLVILSEIMFDGTIVPVAVIIFAYAALAAVCYGMVSYRLVRSPDITDNSNAEA